MLQRAAYRTCESLGWLRCELAFKTLLRAVCVCVSSGLPAVFKADEAGIRSAK